MKNLNNAQIVYKTICENFVQTQKSKLLEKLKNNVVVFEENLFTLDKIYVDKTESFEEIFYKALQHNEAKSIKIFEDLEYELAYKYSSLYTINDSILPYIYKLIESGNIIEVNEYNSDFISDWQYNINLKPSFKKIDDNTYCLKFSNALSGHKTAESSSRITIKYPVIVVIYNDLNILEVRLDTVKQFLRRGDEFFYINQISRIINWVQNNLNITPLPLELSKIVDFISDSDEEVVNVVAKELKYKTGSKVVLDTGINDTPILPLLGDLKQLIVENDNLFSSCGNSLKIRDILDNFISEIEETSDSPWISLRWNDEITSKATKVKFSFNYKERRIDLLQYYNTSGTEMERMNNVTRYLIEYKKKYEAEGITHESSREDIKDTEVL